jgi:hypothetical protein
MNASHARTWRIGLVGAALALGACGANGAHVIGPGVSSPPATPSTTTSAGSSSSTPSNGTARPPTSSTISPSQEAEIVSELNALDASLGAAQNDLTHPNPGDR